MNEPPLPQKKKKIIINRFLKSVILNKNNNSAIEREEKHPSGIFHKERCKHCI